jgi:hypothetical protein
MNGNKTDRPQREPARGWHRNAIAMNLCKVYWTRSGTNVLLGRQRPPRRKQNTADRLILMGDWRDSFAAMIEETGAVWLLVGI